MALLSLASGRASIRLHPSLMQMEYCDRDCLGGAIKGGVFRAVEGKWSEATSLRSLIRTAKEMAQVGERAGEGGRGREGERAGEEGRGREGERAGEEGRGGAMEGEGGTARTGAGREGGRGGAMVPFRPHCLGDGAGEEGETGREGGRGSRCYVVSLAPDPSRRAWPICTLRALPTEAKQNPLP